MHDVFAALYPSEAHSLDIQSLPVPRIANPPKQRANTDSVEAFYGPRLMHRLQVRDGDELAVIDKAFPHSRYDVMFLASDERIKSSVLDLRPATKRFAFGLAKRFVDFVSKPENIREFGLEGGNLHMSFNFSRDTVDRESSMFFEKRFHLHLNYIPGGDLKFAKQGRWGELESLSLRRRLLDPATFVGADVLRDALRGTRSAAHLMPVDHERDLRMGLPAGLKATLPDWAFVGTPAFVELLDELHATAASAYASLRAAFVYPQGSRQPWSRPSLRPIADIAAGLDALTWLEPRTRAAVFALASRLKNLPDGMMARFRRSEHDRVRCLALDGLDYSLGLFVADRNSEARPLTSASPIYMNLQTRLFGDIGGAGVPPIYPHPMVRLDRSAGPVLTPENEAQRSRFREAFLASVSTEIEHELEKPAR